MPDNLPAVPQTEKQTLHNSEKYQWAQGCYGWHLLKAGHIAVIREEMTAGTSEKMHYHERSDQLFIVLSGMATFIVDGKETEVGADENIYISHGLKHLVMNRSASTLTFIVISTPPSHNDRVNT